MPCPVYHSRPAQAPALDQALWWGREILYVPTYLAYGEVRRTGLPRTRCTNREPVHTFVDLFRSSRGKFHTGAQNLAKDSTGHRSPRLDAVSLTKPSHGEQSSICGVAD
ncbi:hypothetical protein BST61_g6246 [Cercospora zeina]